ncbi:hypothetical protein B0H16DRAFT_1530620 [Mycena metata]|uniref:Uncharacterized protein n=1 Tax=Mycena metata TaxID=1033252 RepID=A0AAD7JEJ3_9AGAR|nr:hypothetical protein B0H16DRAFT_1530620 [Mycena metata]
MLSFTLLLSAIAFGSALAKPLQRSTTVDISETVCLALNEDYSISSDGYGLKTSINVNATVIECIYLDQQVCYYNRNDGSMRSGSAHTCPGSINKTKITVSELVCLSIDLQAHALIGVSVTVTESFLACAYSDASMCTYSKQGTLNQGHPTSCPKTVSSAPSSSSSGSSSGSSSSSLPPGPAPFFGCDLFDNNSANLISGEQTAPGDNVECDYSDKEKCLYSAAGHLVSGDRICPTALIFTAQGGQTAVCPPFDNTMAFLQAFTITVDRNGVNECDYSDGEACFYNFDGSFNSGSRTICPASISTSQIDFPPIGGAAAAAPAGAGKSLLAAEDNSNSSSSASDNDTTISKPILFALLGMNGFLVLAVLTIAGTWIFGRRTEGPSRLRSLSTGAGYKTVDSISVPLSHGSDEGHYYDAPKR